jgi:putative flippase GtrA
METINKRPDTVVLKKTHTYIIIPAYQPSEALIPLVRSIVKEGYSVVIVDDGSGQKYSNIFISLMPVATILKHSVNRGKGEALKTAIEYLIKIPAAENVITMDADGQHLVPDMEKVARASWKHPEELILGVREFKENVPLRSKFGNTITRSVFRIVSGSKVSDTQTGLRGFGSCLFDYMLGIDGDRYEYEMNVLLHAKERGILIQEIPIATVYADNKNSTSHFNTVKDSIRIYKDIFKFASSSMISFAVDYLLFSFFLSLTSGLSISLILSNVSARIISAGVNFTLNQRAVFKDSQPISKTLPKYAALALCILAANTMILSFLTDFVMLNPLVAKIITELLLFFVSYIVQSLFIFSKNRMAKKRIFSGKEQMTTGIQVK